MYMIRGRSRGAAALLPVMMLTLWIGLAGVAAGHAHLREGNPAPGSTVTEPIKEVHLQFSEAVEVGFSTFKVYPLKPQEDEQALNAAARALMEDVLRKRGDEADRVDIGLADGGATSENIVILLRDDLQPGPYVVMWRVLSVDTHVTQEYYTFTYAP